MNEVVQKSAEDQAYEALKALHDRVADDSHAGMVGIVACVAFRDKADPGKWTMYNYNGGEINYLGATANVLARAAEQQERAFNALGANVNKLSMAVDALLGQQAVSAPRIAVPE